MDRVWYGKSLSSRLAAGALWPLELGYRAALLARRRPRPISVGVPVLSVGNLTVGGNGKTPLVVDLAGRLAARSLKVAVVTRGYRRRSREPLLFAGSPPPTASEAGDEPALIAGRLPQVLLVVDADRVRAARLAVQKGAEVIVADDAFQHWRLERRLDVLAVHARRGLGNRRLLPAGPLREPPSEARRAQAVVFTYAAEESAGELCRIHGIDSPGLATCCGMEPDGFVAGPELSPAAPPAGPAVAFCGLADSGGFFEMCRRAGLKLLQRIPFPDHHFFSASDLRRLESHCRSSGAPAVCSEKDLVRLPAGLDFPVLALRLSVSWREPEVVERLLDRLSS